MINSFLFKNLSIPKSIHIFLVLMALTSFSIAQTPQYYNYNTSGTSSNSFPFNIAAGKKVQLLYLPGDFNQPAPAPVGRITSIYFRISDTYPLGPWTYTDLTIKMGQTEITSFTSGEFYTGTLDTVYYKASISLSGTAGQWMIIPLDTSYVYDPEKSLIIDIGQCGVSGATGFSMSFTTLSGSRRNWSIGGCPFAYSNQNSATYHLGLDICPVPSAPVNITPPENQHICGGTTTILSASGTGNLSWYSDSTGGYFVGSGTDFITPALLKDTVFYAQDSACGFPSKRTAIAVTVNPAYSFVENFTICGGDTLNWQGQDYATEGIYVANYTSITGCDSIYTLNLTVNPVYSIVENHSVCAMDIYSWQGEEYTEAGTYFKNYTSISGCDSNYTLNLTFNPLYSYSEDHSICEGETYSWQGYDYTTAGEYMASYVTVTGCDSIYTLNLTVNPSYSFAEDQYICEGESYNWQGTDYTTGGTYSARFTSINGCDSIYNLNLTVNSVDVSITANDTVITANAIGAAYQWLSCDDAFAPLSGETMQSYTPVENGHYAVMVTQGSCSDTSDCIPISKSGIDFFSAEGMTIYPNPVSDELIIEIKGNQKKMVFEILNSTGQMVYKGNILQKTAVNTSKFTSGIYLVKIESGKNFVFKKIIKD